MTAVNAAFTPPSKAKKADYSCSFELVDESKTKLTCTMLDCNHDYLPKSLCCGDMVCLRKISIEQSAGQLAVRTSANTTWLLFRKQEEFKASSSFTSVSLGHTERGRLTDLKVWVAEEEEAGE